MPGNLTERRSDEIQAMISRFWPQEGFSVHFPIVTCIVIALLLTFLIWLFRR
jgi:hypothetical protein